MGKIKIAEKRKSKIENRKLEIGNWKLEKAVAATSCSLAMVNLQLQFFTAFFTFTSSLVLSSSFYSSVSELFLRSTSNLPHLTMIIFTDKFSGDELLSDAYDVSLVDDVVYEADCQMIKVNAGADVDIGANPSAEDGGDDLEEGVEVVNNVVYSFRLQPTAFDKKSFLTYIKGYMKSIKAKLAESDPDAIPTFEKGAATYVKKVIGSFKDWEFYTGESMDPDAMIVLMNYREDGVTPFVSIWKHGVNETKI